MNFRRTRAGRSINRVMLAACVSALTAPAAALATTVGPLQELTATPANASQRAPAAAWDGTRYVIIWEDGRSSGNGTELYLTRMMPDGTIIDANGFPLLSPAQPGNQTQPTIAHSVTGNNFIVAWTDPRAGSADIYAARYFPMMSGAVPEPGGIQLTTGSDAESSPSIACANQSCLISYQANVPPPAGGSRIRGVRLLPTGDILDTQPRLLVSGQTGLKPTTLAFPGNFVVGWEDNGDLRMRTVPDIGAITANTGTPLAAANLRQSSVSMAGFSSSSFMSAWQDQRAGTSTQGDDIYARLFMSDLTPGSPESVVIGASRNQIFPVVAAGNGHAMVVWEDFQRGAVGITYGTILNQNAAARPPPSAFPLIAFNSNIIEQTVVKGPGDDYLVLAVRSFPSPQRIFYRIVREELPMGTMTAMGTLQVPADGATAAAVSFGPAVGASGFKVVDGTLYTLTLSRAVDVTVPDADSTMPGHQVVAVDGLVNFGLTTLRPGPVTVSLASTEGVSTGVTTVTFDNVPPESSNLRITPSQPRSSEDLTLMWSYSDLNGDPEGAPEIQWTRNSAVQPQVNNSVTVPASRVRRGEVWQARFRPFDGSDYGSFVFSNEVIILNTPPLALEVRIVPDNDVRTNTELRAIYRFDDPDNDAEMGTQIRWFDRGMAQPQLDDATSVPAAMVIKGQRWRFDVTPSDGSNPGPKVSSATVAVVNSPPDADAGMLSTVVERRTHMLDGTASSDVDPQDRLTYQWTQLNAEPLVQIANARSATTSFVAPSVSSTTMLRFGLTVSDGVSTSSQAVVVVNVTAVRDSDADGLDDEEEADLGTDPSFGDTDRDGLMDGEEVSAGTDPLDEDSDDDGVRDGAEMMATVDTDNDGLINALDPDSDDDGLFDGTELSVDRPLMGTNTTTASNFIADADTDTGTDPLVADTDGDMLLDGDEDANHNGKIDLGESDPNDPTSKTGCTMDRMCAGDQICERDACRDPPPADGGIMCRPLAAIGVQCCAGSTCQLGVPADPVCRENGNREVCPAGTMQCPLSACQGAPEPAPEGCACSATESHVPTDSPVGFLVLLLFVASRRGRRGRDSN